MLGTRYGQTEMMKLTVVFRDFVNAPKNSSTSTRGAVVKFAGIWNSVFTTSAFLVSEVKRQRKHFAPTEQKTCQTNVCLSQL